MRRFESHGIMCRDRWCVHVSIHKINDWHGIVHHTVVWNYRCHGSRTYVRRTKLSFLLPTRRQHLNGLGKVWNGSNTPLQGNSWRKRRFPSSNLLPADERNARVHGKHWTTPLESFVDRGRPRNFHQWFWCYFSRAVCPVQQLPRGYENEEWIAAIRFHESEGEFPESWCVRQPCWHPKPLISCHMQKYVSHKAYGFLGEAAVGKVLGWWGMPRVSLFQRTQDETAQGSNWR